MFHLPRLGESTYGIAHILVLYLRGSQQTFQEETPAAYQGSRSARRRRGVMLVYNGSLGHRHSRSLYYIAKLHNDCRED